MKSLRGLTSGLGIFLLAVVLMALTGCSNLDYLNFTVPNRGYWRTNDLAFGPEARQKLDVYVPTKVPANGKVIIFFYGGSWRNGDKSNYRYAGQGLTEQGYIVVLPNYRLHPQVVFPAFVQDGAAAVRWTRDHIAEYGGDTNQIYLMGHSAGAHLVTMLTFDERFLQAVGLGPKTIRATVAMSGPYDFPLVPENCSVFGLTTNIASQRPEHKPITFVDGNEPPILLLHGKRDWIVPPWNAEQLANRIRSAGGDVELTIYPGRGHAELVIGLAWPNLWMAPVVKDTTDFLQRH